MKSFMKAYHLQDYIQAFNNTKTVIQQIKLREQHHFLSLHIKGTMYRKM